MDNTTDNSPVFLIASVRSGSTLLHLMLNSHPDIVNPGECDFLFDETADDGTPPEMAHYHKWLQCNRIFMAKNLKIDMSLDYAQLINSFVHQMRRPGSVIAMNVHRHFYRIPKAFPKAKYIHLIRDGRDVARSCIGMGWVGNVYYGIDIWRDAEIAWDKLKESLHPAQYVEIKYENLLEDVESELGKICRFIGLEYSKNMLDYASQSTYSLPDRNLSYQWKKKYSKQELSLVEGKAEKLLIARGYKLSGVAVCEPSMIKKIILYFQNKQFRVMHQLSTYGFPLFFQYYLARKLGIASWQRILKTRINAVNTKRLK